MIFRPARAVALIAAFVIPSAPTAFAFQASAPGVPISSATSTATQAAPSRHGSRGLYLARTALSYRGMAYRWGGRSPRTGFDCSGLVQNVCAHWGIYLPRVARGQYKTGIAVSRKDLQAGDLVFFKNTYRRGLSHVGIYIGSGRFIHAAGARQGVRVSRLDEGYHLNHWAGARRLNLSKLPAAPGESPLPPKIIIDPEAATDAPSSAAPTIPSVPSISVQ